MTAPSFTLDKPYPGEPVPEDLNTFIGLHDWLHPTEIIRKAIEYIFSFNPGEMVADWVGGDWKAVSEAGVAPEQMNEYVGRFGYEINQVRIDMMDDWEGHAASAADKYFELLALQIDEVSSHLHVASQQYHFLAGGILALAEEASNGVHEIEDKLIAMGVKAIAAAALSETVVGSLIFGAWAASDAKKCVDRWLKVYERYETTITVVHTSIGALETLLGSFPSTGEMVLPAGYDHPGVP
ncbi:hypothetical protein H5V45_13360 [Nocardioides sp. KIGAM211]|uniref:Uncharacterized protein n=1 Tax=Nocardioides luti TaxID=2761101 RepID=A0A7X0RHA2_9ACTN|nr:hypothetical protein [Nocardioides luti]MBB6628308.1 hypothetical protein [Nocardioides luti]